jgi:predicted MPP superfamily phosphohydrolase
MRATQSIGLAIAFAALAATTGCVKGNPETFSDNLTDTGGTVAVPGCPYSVTTKVGAEPPTVADGFIGPDPTPKYVHLSVIGDPKTSIVAQWRTNDETTHATTIRYAQGANLSASSLSQTAGGVQFAYASEGTNFRMHQAHLCNLLPATSYSYQVGSTDPTTGTAYFSPVYTFHTAPDTSANPDAEVTLGFVGDSRGGYDIWTQMISQLIARAPDLILFSGDAVTFGITQTEWEDFFGDAEPLFATVPMVAADGNHEGNAINFYAQIAMPGDQENYGLDYGYAHVTVINDTPEDPNDLTTTTQDALKADLTASDGARWKLMMNHQPLYSASTKHGSNLTLQAAWQPIIDAHNVDLVLNGHDHDYEVSFPLIGQTPQPTIDTGTVYIVAGGAGAELYDSGTGFWTNYSESTYSSAIIDVRRDQMTFDAFRQDGSAIPTGYSKTKN